MTIQREYSHLTHPHDRLAKAASSAPRMIHEKRGQIATDCIQKCWRWPIKKYRHLVIGLENGRQETVLIEDETVVRLDKRYVEKRAEWKRCHARGDAVTDTLGGATRNYATKNNYLRATTFTLRI